MDTLHPSLTTTVTRISGRTLLDVRNCNATLLNGFRGRKRAFWNGKELRECGCQPQIGDQLRYWDYMREEREWWMWMPQGGGCLCEHTGWVCGYCDGTRWVKTYHGRHTVVIPCPECAHMVNKNGEEQVGLDDGEIVPQAWWRNFVSQFARTQRREEWDGEQPEYAK